MEKQIIRSEITTDNFEYASALERIHRDQGLAPHDGYMWRVTEIEWRDYSQTVTYGGMWEGGPEPGVYHVPGPTVWFFRLERDEGALQTAG
jgi:hypothetical protein